MSFILNSVGITENVIDDRYGKWSDDILENIPQISLPLHWSGTPAGTESFAITFIDYDNIEDDGISWVHWLVANIPGSVGCLVEDASRRPSSISNLVVQGRNTWSIEPEKCETVCTRYGGPSPVKFAHEYELKIFALDKYLNLKNGFTYNQMLKEMRGSVLEEATLHAIYRA